ncbi:MAG: PTS glucose transporter subunit IIA [Solobacterium sp.]|nr:PTS glucose transporter subunit IIA [Solobacterium sp.]
MALDYRKCAQEIVDHIGGRDNVAQAAHCATRLRLVIKDNSKVDKDYLDNIEGVKGMFESNGQLQLIIGTGTVNKVYDEFLDITGMTAATKDDVKAAAAAQEPLWKRLLKPIGDVFVPILPAIVASGLMMGLVEALGKALPGFASSDWYGFLDMVANAAFVFLPGIVAISAARVFGGNIFLGAVIGLLMIHPSLINAWSVATYEGAIPTWKIFIFPVQQVGYQGHVIPLMIAVFLMCQIEKWLHKHVPEMLDLFITPLTTVLVTSYITFTIIGPIFAQLETWVLAGAKILVRNPIGACVMGAIYPWTVVMGLHHMYNVIEAGMLAESGLNTWMPIASAASFAQFGACLAVGIKAKNMKTKSVAIPSSMSAALGITEPAIFGVNMRFFKPFLAGMAGGAVGAIFGALTGLGATAYGVTGIPGYLTINNPLVYTVLLAISGGIAFALTTMIWKEEDAPAAKTASAPAAAKEQGAPTAWALETEAGIVKSPVNGKIIPAKDIPDPVFAQETMGPSVGIEPSEGIVYAPFDGTVMMVFPTNHAIGLKADNGIELLIHVGVDTVNMNGDGFQAFVKQDDKVRAGDKLLSFDRAKIKAADHPDTVIVAITNGFDYKDIKRAA